MMKEERPIQLYGYFRSGNTRKVRLCLAELGVDYEMVVVDITAAGQRSPDYLGLNPNGLVPTLVDGELVLWESSAILLYLAEKYPHAGLLPHTFAKRARVYKWLVWQPTTFNPPRQRLVTELAKPAAAQDAHTIAALRATIARNLEILAEALANADYLLGQYTLADLVMLPHLAALNESGFALPGTLRRYLEQLAARPAWQATLAYRG
nr:F110 [uncultured bacterium]